jgi:hypothetical protein
MSAPKKFRGKPPKVRTNKHRTNSGNQLPDVDSIRDAFADAEAFVNVVYMAFQVNGRDGPEQPVLWHAIQNFERIHEQLDAACNQLAHLSRKKASAFGGTS